MTTDDRLARIETTLEEIKNRIFGGDIDEGEIGHLKARVTKLENWRWWLLGAAAVLAASGGLGRVLAEVLIRK
jgi:hypothetical protein